METRSLSPNDTPTEKKIAVFLPLYEDSPSAFQLVSDLTQWNPNLWVWVLDAIHPRQDQNSFYKIKGLAQITPRVQIIKPQETPIFGILHSALSHLERSEFTPDIVITIEENTLIDEKTIPSIVNQLYQNDRLGALSSVAKQDGNQIQTVRESNIVAFKYQALTQTRDFYQIFNIEKSLTLEQIKLAGWDVSTKPLPRAKPQNLLISTLEKPLQTSFKRLGSLKRSLTSLSISLKDRINYKAVVSSVTITRRLSLAGIWLLLFILGLNQLRLLPSSLIPVVKTFWPQLTFSNENTIIEQTIAGTAHQVQNNSHSTDIEEKNSSPASTNPCTVKNIEKEEMPLKLIIPTINLDLEVKPVPLINGTWEVHDYVANFATGTSLPNGKRGNTGLFGHDRPHAFAPIKRLTTGDEIILLTDTYRFVYTVKESQQVSPQNVEVFYGTKEPELTLLTCDGTFSKQRFAVKADLVKVELRDCAI